MGNNGNGKKEDSITIIQNETKLLDAEENESEEFITGYDSVPQGDKLGVMQRLVTAVLSDKQYRQVLLLASTDNKHEANLAADAISERLRYGVTIQPIVDRLISQCSIKGGRVNVLSDILTRYQIQHNYGANVPGWKKKQDQSVGGSRML